MPYKIIILILVTVFSPKSYSQSEIDSLRFKLKNSSGTEKADLLNNLSNALKLIDPDKAKEYALQAFYLSDSLNYQKGGGYAEKNLGYLAYLYGDFKTANENIKHASDIADDLNDLYLKKQVYEVLALIYEETNSFDQSLRYFQYSYEMSKTLENPVGMGIAQMGSARLYEKLNQYDLSLQSNRQAMNIFMKLENMVGMAKSTISIAKNYSQLDNMDSSLFYFKKGENLIRDLDSKELLLELYTIKSEIYSDSYVDSSLAYSARAIDLAENLNRLYLKRDLLLQLSDLHTKKGEYQLAYQYHQQYSKMNDSLYNIQGEINPGRWKLTLNDAIYSEQQSVLEKYLSTQKSETQQNRILIFGFGGVIICLIAFMSWFLYRYNKQTESKKRFDILQNEIATLSEEISKKEEIIQRIKEKNQSSYQEVLEKKRMGDTQITGLTPVTKKEITFEDLYKDATSLFISEQWEALRKVRNDLECIDESPDQGNTSKERWSHLNLHALMVSLIGLKKANVEGQINFHYNPDPAINLYCQKGSIILLIDCFLQNAIESIEEKKGDIYIEHYANHEKITIKITDTGSGIIETDNTKIFDSFYSTKKSELHLGLGLTVSREIIKSHQAQVSLRSIPKLGTEFSIEFFYH